MCFSQQAELAYDPSISIFNPYQSFHFDIQSIMGLDHPWSPVRLRVRRSGWSGRAGGASERWGLTRMKRRQVWNRWGFLVIHGPFTFWLFDGSLKTNGLEMVLQSRKREGWMTCRISQTLDLQDLNEVKTSLQRDIWFLFFWGRWLDDLPIFQHAHSGSLWWLYFLSRFGSAIDGHFILKMMWQQPVDIIMRASYNALHILTWNKLHAGYLTVYILSSMYICSYTNARCLGHR